MTRPKDIGTIGETAVVRYLVANGFPHAERRALAGQYDLGDIVGTPGVCWEVKAGKVAEACAGGHLREWQDQTDVERENSRSDIGVLVLKRKAVGAANAGQWWAYIRLSAICDQLLREAVEGGPYEDFDPTHDVWVRMQLSEATRLLRLGGYGDPIDGAVRG